MSDTPTTSVSGIRVPTSSVPHSPPRPLPKGRSKAADVKDVFITLAELKARPLPPDDWPRAARAAELDPISGEPRVLGSCRAVVHKLDEGRRFGMSMDMRLDDAHGRPDRSERAFYLVYKRLVRLRNEFKAHGLWGGLEIFDVPLRPGMAVSSQPALPDDDEAGGEDDGDDE